MPNTDSSRRQFLKTSAIGVTAVGLGSRTRADPPRSDAFVDVHVYLRRWPFGRLHNDELASLVRALRTAGVTQAWAGSFEALLHKDVAGVNARLAAACRREGNGLLVPFGAVNPTLPDWEDDLRRCRDELGMPGIRLHPIWHGYKLDDKRFLRVLQLAAEHRMIVQLECDAVDVRRPCLALPTAPADLSPLAAQVQQAPGLRLVLVLLKQGWSQRLDEVPALAALNGVYLAGRHFGRALARIANEVSAGPLLFASGTPLRPPQSGVFDSSGLSAAQEQLIAHGTASELLAAAANAP